MNAKRWNFDLHPGVLLLLAFVVFLFIPLLGPSLAVFGDVVLLVLLVMAGATWIQRAYGKRP